MQIYYDHLRDFELDFDFQLTFDANKGFFFQIFTDLTKNGFVINSYN